MNELNIRSSGSGGISGCGVDSDTCGSSSCFLNKIADFSVDRRKNGRGSADQFDFNAAMGESIRHFNTDVAGTDYSNVTDSSETRLHTWTLKLSAIVCKVHGRYSIPSILLEGAVLLQLR